MRARASYSSGVTEDEPRPLIEGERNRRQHAEKQRELAQHPERAKIVTRAVVRIVHNYEKEARVGQFTFSSDEHAPVGEGSAPSPLQYFVAAVGL